MIIFIPMWLIWTIGIAGGILLLMLLALLIAFFLMDAAFRSAFRR